MNTQPFVIALIGQANAGKTTVFNQLTGSHYKTVNYPGSTVDFEKGTLSNTTNITVLDVPGISSLKARSHDEKIALNSLTELDKLLPKSASQPQLILSVVDCTQRSRHLSLTKQLLDSGFNVIVVLTMTDLAKKQGKLLDQKKLEDELNCPVIPVNGRTGAGIKQLSQSCVDQLNRPTETTRSITIQKRSPKQIKEDLQWAETLVKNTQLTKSNLFKSLDPDKVFLHWFWGPICFLGIMGSFFYSIFALAAPLMDGIDSFFGASISLLNGILPAHFLTTLLVEGIWAGMGAVVIFIPQIAILFFGIGLLESSGYLARGATLVDRVLSKMGLTGRSFVPLLSGCACAIPAMMAARNIPKRHERLLCLFIIPLMQCAARLPVYGLLLAILFPGSALKSGLGLMGIYITSIIVASIVATIGARYLNVTPSQNYFTIELPSWRMPIWKHLIVHVWQQTKSFITGAGPVIVVLAIILWGLGTFPSQDASFAMHIGKFIEPLFLPMGVDWRVGVALLLSFAAREIFVSVLVVMFTIGGSETTLLNVLKYATFQGTDSLIFTPATSIGLIVFFMIALQCAATVAIARKEMGNWRLPLIQAGTYIVGAYLLSIILVQGLRLFGVS